MSNGIKTIEAADNGLSSITKTVESMQSTLRQARQDKSFKTQSFTLDSSASGNISFSGGAVGTQVDVPLATGSPIQGKLAASADYVSPAATSGSFSFAYSADPQFFGGDDIEVALTVDGASDTFYIDSVQMGMAGNPDGDIDNINELTDVINQALGFFASSLGVVASNDGTNVTLTSTSSGSTSNVTIDAVTPNGLTSTYGLTAGAGTPGTAAGNKDITISNGASTANITLTAANAATVGQARSYIQSELTAQGVTGITVGGSGNRIDLTGAANGSTSVAVGGAGATDVFGAAPLITANNPAGSFSVDQLVQSINSNSALKDKVRASNDNGKLRIENLSTEALEIEGVGTDGEIDGTTGTVDIGGNEVRKNLVKQFNELRDQLDKLSDDASFNGINLLRGDKLKLTFNESGTSTIDIQAKDADGDPTSVNNTTLGITSAVFADFDNDSSLDARLGKLGDALGKLRSQASAFGSNLSIVENRNDFTKSMINTLETGAANLTLADTNQEAANLLALQTRQQLSSTALSMASQADQAVLRLF